MKRGLILFIFVLLIGSVNALKLESQTCEVNGGFTITLGAEDKNESRVDEIELKVDDKLVEGEWDIDYFKKNPPNRKRETGIFTSDEGQVLGGGNKIIEITYPLEFEGVKSTEIIKETLECPEFHFSCALLDLQVDECYTENNVFYGFFIAKGFEQSNIGTLSIEDNLEFGLFAEKAYEDIKNRIVTNGVKPKNAEVKKFEGDKYVMIYEFPEDNSVNRFRVGFSNLNQCFSSNYDKYNLELDGIGDCYIKGEEVIEPEVVEEVEEVIEEIKEVEEIQIPEELPEKEVEKDSSDMLPAVILVLILAIGIGILFKIKKKF